MQYNETNGTKNWSIPIHIIRETPENAIKMFFFYIYLFNFVSIFAMKLSTQVWKKEKTLRCRKRRVPTWVEKSHAMINRINNQKCSQFRSKTVCMVIVRPVLGLKNSPKTGLDDPGTTPRQPLTKSLKIWMQKRTKRYKLTQIEIKSIN